MFKTTCKTTKTFCVLLTVIALIGLAGCGRKGDLVLPENKDKPPAEKSADMPTGQ